MPQNEFGVDEQYEAFVADVHPTFHASLVHNKAVKGEDDKATPSPKQVTKPDGIMPF